MGENEKFLITQGESIRIQLQNLRIDYDREKEGREIAEYYARKLAAALKYWSGMSTREALNIYLLNNPDVK